MLHVTSGGQYCLSTRQPFAARWLKEGHRHPRFVRSLNGLLRYPLLPTYGCVPCISLVRTTRPTLPHVAWCDAGGEEKCANSQARRSTTSRRTFGDARILVLLLRGIATVGCFGVKIGPMFPRCRRCRNPICNCDGQLFCHSALAGAPALMYGGPVLLMLAGRPARFFR